jgi:hypothetical protein
MELIMRVPKKALVKKSRPITFVKRFATVINSALFVALLVFCFQQYNIRKVDTENKKMQIWIATTADFACFRAFRERLDVMAFAELKEPGKYKKNDHFNEVKQEYVFKRNECKDKLLADFQITKYYFSSDTSKLIDDFTAWDRQYAIKTVEYLPSDEKYAVWHNTIVASMRQQLK